MNPDRVDLNLLRVFDAIYEDRNLLRAGERLHLSQSAVSHALARLREALQGAIDGFIVERGLARQSETFDRRALEDALAPIQAGPRLRMAVPHSLAIPALLRDTDMMSLVPEPLAREFMRDGGIAMKELPYASPSVTLRAVSHRRNEHDPAHVWLRQQVVSIAAAVQP